MRAVGSVNSKLEVGQKKKTFYTADYGDQQVEKFYNHNRKQRNHHDHYIIFTARF